MHGASIAFLTNDDPGMDIGVPYRSGVYVPRADRLKF